jgi:hypothetical protein
MTIEELESVRGMASEVQAIQNEIESLYTPICSPNGQSSGGHSNTPSDPTERAVNRILEIRADLEKRIDDYTAEIKRVEEWVATLKDKNLAAIIRYHYISGYDWIKTGSLVNDSYSDSLCRKKVRRYFGLDN